MNYRFGLLLGSSCIAGLAALAPIGAFAQDYQPTVGPYVGGYIGGNFPRHISPSGGAADDLPGYFDGNLMGAGTLGYGLGNGFRVELEGAYAYNDLRKVHNSLLPVHRGLRQWIAMVNGIYDIDTAAMGMPDFGIVPHIGAGVGAAVIYPEHAGYFGGNTIAGENNSFAYQGIVGLGYQIMPNLKLDVDYHYVGSENQNHTTQPTAASAAKTGTSTSFDVENHEVLVGLRYEFGEPEMAPQPAAPPPAAAPAPMPAVRRPEAQRSFEVFFDFDKSNITAAAARVIRAAADAARAGNFVRINVTGHTDTVGSAAYNLRLSERRANAVKQQLIADGLQADEITAVGVGKAGLLVPTADGVREPQNRRAEIVLQQPGT